MEYYPALKKEGNPAICYNINEPRGPRFLMLSEISQSQKEEYCMIPLT